MRRIAKDHKSWVMAIVMLGVVGVLLLTADLAYVRYKEHELTLPLKEDATLLNRALIKSSVRSDELVGRILRLPLERNESLFITLHGSKSAKPEPDFYHLTYGKGDWTRQIEAFAGEKLFAGSNRATLVRSRKSIDEEPPPTRTVAVHHGDYCFFTRTTQYDWSTTRIWRIYSALDEGRATGVIERLEFAEYHGGDRLYEVVYEYAPRGEACTLTLKGDMSWIIRSSPHGAVATLAVVSLTQRKNPNDEDRVVILCCLSGNYKSYNNTVVLSEGEGACYRISKTGWKYLQPVDFTVEHDTIHLSWRAISDEYDLDRVFVAHPFLGPNRSGDISIVLDFPLHPYNFSIKKVISFDVPSPALD